MRKINLLLLSCFVFVSALIAQDLDRPGIYMDAMENAHKEMDQKYMAYMSASSHGKRARKVEKLRAQVLESINNTKSKVLDLPFYKGDNSLRQSNIDYISMCYSIFNEDYAKIVNMEDISEQSFDEMQAYLLLKEKVDEKLNEACDKINKAGVDFAAKYNVTLVEGQKSKLAQKMAITNKVNKYYKPIHLIFFKCNWQDQALTKALNEVRLTDIEQTRTSVIKFAEDGLLALQAIQPYEGDRSLIDACREVMIAYKGIAEKETPVSIDYQLKKENFEKIQKSFEAKSKSERTKDAVNEYNKSINDYNAAVNQSNQASVNANKKRNEAFKGWEDAVKTFFDKYTPYYR